VTRLMQLSGLYGVRGAMATQTMANLTEEQIQEVDRIVRMVADDPALAADKFEFTKQLSNTIKADYKSDRETAIHEFYIALWRATVYLLYHCDYTYYCTLCGQTEYNTSTGKRKSFDRQYPICPYCNRSLLNGQIVYLRRESHRYYFVTENGVKASEQYGRRSEIENIVTSPIKAITGNKKVQDPYKILNDAKQRSKWYSVWVWNYFRQILNENTIRTHNKHQMCICGPANSMAVYEIINEFKRIGKKYYVDESTLYDNEVEILTNTIATDKTWVAFFVSLVNKYRNYDVDITYTFFSIKVKANKEMPIIETTITTEDPVIMLSFNTPSPNNDDNGNWSNALEINAYSKQDIANSHLCVDENDWIRAVRKSLPDDICRCIFDIYIQEGPIWTKFSDQFGYHEAAKSHLSKFLGIPIKQVNTYRSQIQDICQGMGIGQNKAYKEKDLIELPITKGEFVVVTTVNNEVLAHLNTTCQYIKEHIGVFDAKNDGWYAGQVAEAKHKFIRLSDDDKLIEMCSYCLRTRTG